MLEIPTEKACPGTNNDFSYTASPERHYRNMRRRYKGCTHIYGNLEVTHLNIENYNYDMSFLEDIRYVSGYVLIGLSPEISVLPLPSLQIIRGNQTIRIRDAEASLAVVLNYRFSDPKVGLTELHLPALREISNGIVMYAQNPRLCYVDTIDWFAITGRGRRSTMFPRGDQTPPFNRKCDGCPTSCKVEGISRCWSSSEKLCQRVLPDSCHRSCPYRCFGPGAEGCCHASCAGGCWGPSDRECMMCKDYRMWNQCVGSCPARFSKLNQICYRQ
ncbi:hypothetical protein SNE40_022681 [Patella caerulea]|uniref:receptor protein-tyrosine kinase n=1 Tax=Patella caerulea TaxID=87958 RepID=A0AAN8GFX5_PATCE